MVKNTSLSATQKRKPRLLWANPFCLLDTSSGASMTVRQMLLQLVARGYDVQVLGATVFDNPKGMGRLKKQFPDLNAHLHQLVEAEDGQLTHQLVVSYSHNRNHLTAHEEGLWYSQYLYMLDSFKPDMVWFYGGQTLDMLIAAEARDRSIPVAFYLANGNYNAPYWCRDVDLILTDSQATADMYRKEVGFTSKPVGKFIAPKNFVAGHHERRRLLFVNPSWQKGASVFVQLAEKLERERPDIELEVVEARADWPAVLRETTRKMGEQRSALSNVVVTPNTSDMRGPYSRARVVVAPSLWWESSGRVLAEAMLNGIPALITNRGGMPEMIGNAGIAFDFPDVCYKEPHQHLLSDDELQPLADAVISLFDDEALYQDYVDRAWQVGKEKHHLDRATERLITALTPLVNLRAGNKDFAITQKKRHRQRLASRATKPEFKVDNSLQQLVGATSGAKQGNEPQANRLCLTENFTWQIKGKIMVLDNRASLIKSGLADQMAATEAFGIVAFDPASEIKDTKQYEGSDYIQLFQHALLGDGKATTLHACVAPEMTSTLTPLPSEKLPKRHHLGAKPLAELPINTVALDSIDGLGNLDWLILDELSDAMAVLEHGKKSLTDTLLIQARVAFQLTHEKQPNLAELQHWASRNGFRFYRFHNISHYSHLPEKLSAQTACATEQESGDVLFLPSHERMATLSEKERMKLAFILSAGFAAHDVAFDLMADVSNEKALEFLEAQKLLPRVAKEREDSDGQHQLLSQRKDDSEVEPHVEKVDDISLYARKMQTMIDNSDCTKVVQVGANDGCINDPIYEVVMRNMDKTKVLLIEPQSNILEHLEKNYALHPEARIANYAVGPDALLSLYRIKPAYYGLFTKRYLHDSPNYRVPSGFSSFDKKHVVKHAEGNLPKNTNVEDAIEKLEVPSYDLLTILEAASWEERQIDILQIDAEGMDDKVIYSCNIEVTRPQLINFERAHLPKEAYKDLCVYLSSLGYALYNYSNLDTLAVRKVSSSLDGENVVVNDVPRQQAVQELKEKSTHQITKRLGELYEFSRKVLAKELNSIHNLDKSERFWDIITHYFLIKRFVPRYISRWNNRLLNTDPKSAAILGIFPRRTFRDFMNKTEMLVGQASPYVVDNVIPADVQNRKLEGAESIDSMKIKEERLKKILNDYEGNKNKMAYNLGVHNPKYWKTRYKNQGIDFVDFPVFDTFISNEVDWDARYKLAKLDETNPAEGYDGFWSSLALCLPTEFLEDFKSLYDVSERVLKGRKPEFVFSALLPTITSRLVAAILTERGVPLYLHQHGGSYGEFPSHTGAAHEKRIATKYYTWGWRDRLEKVVPEKPHRLIELKKQYSKINRNPKEILVIAPHKSVVPDYIAGTDLDYYDESVIKKYYESLDEENKKMVVVRLRRQHGYSPEEERKMLLLFPGAKLDTQKRSILQAYASAKEVVVMMPFSTTAQECEYLGIPYRVLIQPCEEFMQIPSFIPESYE